MRKVSDAQGEISEIEMRIIRRFGDKIRRSPTDPLSVGSLFLEQALMHRELGESLAARQFAERAVSICPDVPRGYETLSRIVFPGEDYYQTLHRFHNHLRPKSYLEIGVDTGASIVLAKFPTVAVGIDPAPRLTSTLETICKIFPMKSDEYFATRDVRGDIESEAANLVFINGLHLFEQTLRDFIHVEHFSTPSTLVLIHDCFAIDALMRLGSERPYFGSATCGRSSRA